MPILTASGGFKKRAYSQATPSLSRSSALLRAYKVLFFERTIGVTPAARAFAHVEYLTAFITLGAGVASAVGVITVGVADGVVDGATRVMGLIPAVTAYAGSEKAVMEVMLH